MSSAAARFASAPVEYESQGYQLSAEMAAALATAGAPVARESNGFRLVDVSGVLPRSRPYPRRSKPVSRIVVHQTDGGIRPVPEGLIRQAEFFIAPKPAGRGWPGFAYTFWVPYAPVAVDGKLTVYRCQPDSVVSNHTKGANADGVAVAFQGRFASPAERHKSAGSPSTEQLQLFDPLLNHLIGHFGLERDAVQPHSDFMDPGCPGFELERQIRRFRGEEDR